MSVKWSWFSISINGIFFIECFLYIAWHTKESWTFSDLVAAISAALHETFVHSKYANSVSPFLLYWMQIICCIKDFVWQLNVFLPSFGHLCACEMFPGWEMLKLRFDQYIKHHISVNIYEKCNQKQIIPNLLVFQFLCHLVVFSCFSGMPQTLNFFVHKYFQKKEWKLPVNLVSFSN